MKKFLLLSLLVSSCVNGEWGKPSQDSAPDNSINLIEFNF